MNRRILLLSILLLFLFGIQDTFARKKKESKEPVKSESKYDKLFKGKARETVKGLMTIHKMDNKVYFEIPMSLFNREMLLGSTITETTHNNFGSVGEKPTDPLHVMFTLTDSVVSLRVVTTMYSTEVAAIKERVAASTRPAVMYKTDIKAYNADKSAVVVDMTDFFVSDNARLTPFSSFSPYVGGGLSLQKEFKKDKSGLGAIKSFPDNFSVQSSLSYEVNVRDSKYYYIYKLPFTSLLTRSFILLPEEPMRPRHADPRIGIFYQGYSSFSHSNKGVEALYYANRWRLEPSDEAAYRAGKLVEPKKPIVFYVDNAFPESWKKYIKQGIEDWQVAFEKIGFKNAIVAKDFPTDDPEFDPDNLKYSCVRYSPSWIANAMGPSWTDPRTGEILNASVYIYHNIVDLVHNWRFLQTGAVDPAVRKKVFDDETLGESLRYVSAHEIGHCLALMHNMGASSAIPTDSLRSPSFTRKYGTTYSIMDYARNNYVAQPGDKERGVRLLPPDLGEHDLYTIAWLYTPLLDAKTAKDEVPTLNRWISEKSGDPVYRYGKQQFGNPQWDPSSLTEDLGDDPVKSATYGIKNLKVVLENMNDWVGKDDADMLFRQNLYVELIYQYVRYINHVLANVGGIYLNERYDGDKRPSYVSVSRARQREALQFLQEQLKDMKWLDAPVLKSKLPLQEDISKQLEEKIYSVLMARTGQIGFVASKSTEKTPYTVREFLKDMHDFAFGPTKQGKSLTTREKYFQTEYLRLAMIHSDVAKKGISGSPFSLTTVEVPSSLRALKGTDSHLGCGCSGHREPVQLKPLMDAPARFDSHELNSEERQGFGFGLFVSAGSVVEPLNHVYYDLLKSTRSLIKSKAMTGSSDTRQHYQLMLYKLDQALN